MPVNRIEFQSLAWNFVSIEGEPDLPGMETEEITKRGVDGVAFVESSFQADTTPMYLTGLAVNYAEMLAWKSSMKNLQGTQVLLYTATGVPYNGLFIKKVTLLSTKYQLVASWLGGVFPDSYKLRWQIMVRYPYGSF